MIGQTNVGNSSSSELKGKAKLRIKAPTGSIINISKGNNIIKTLNPPQGQVDVLDGYWSYYYIILQPSEDIITVTGIFQQIKSSKTIIMSESYYYDIEIDFVWGVLWDKSSSPVLTRTYDAEQFSNPVAAKGIAEGSSPFDSLAPWSNFEEFNIIDEQISYKKGDTGFSRTEYDTVIRIPKFYYKVTSGTNWELQVSPLPMPGLNLHPAFLENDYIYISKYLAGPNYVTKSGQTPISDMTRAQFRTNALNKGSHWDCLTITIWNAIQMLYLVEFANFNSQAMVGSGQAFNGDVKTATGGCDNMTYHTGYAVGGTDGKSSVIYRGIEDLWGHIQTWCVGINFSSAKPYVCFNRSKFIDSGTTNYTALSFNVPTSGNVITSFGYDANNSWIFLPATANTSTDTSQYITDYMWGGSSGVTLQVGGGSSNEGRAGIFSMSFDNTTDYTANLRGGRLVYFP